MSRHPRALALFEKVLLASASIPGVFAPVAIKVIAPVRDPAITVIRGTKVGHDGSQVGHDTVRE